MNIHNEYKTNNYTQIQHLHKHTHIFINTSTFKMHTNTHKNTNIHTNTHKIHTNTHKPTQNTQITIDNIEQLALDSPRI